MKISKTQVFISGSVIALSLIVSTPIVKAQAQNRKDHSFIHVARGDAHHEGFKGSISATSGNRFTLERFNRSGTTTINIITSSTTHFTKDAYPATFADLSSGEHVVVKGSKDIVSGVITASDVHIYTQIPAKHPSFRRVHDHEKKAI